MEPKNWLHPASINIIKNTKEDNDDNLQIFTDGSKNEHGIGAGAVSYTHLAKFFILSVTV